MLKVVIADDEQRVCKLVQMIVDWDALGMAVVGTAANGLEAIQLVEELKPDILITDIRMPGCSGLELVEKAKAILPNLQIALISGYADFEYARTAIGLDVGGYILKPIKKDVITAALEKLGNKCREQLDTASTTERLLHDSQVSGELLKSRLPEDLLSLRIDKPSRELLEDKYGFVVSDGLLQVFIIKIDCAYPMLRDPSMDIIRKKAGDIFGSVVSPLCESFVFKPDASAGYGILNFIPENQNAIRRALRECLNQLEAYKFNGAEVTLAIGKPVGRAEDLPEAMRDSQIAVAERLVEGTGRVLEAGFTYDPLSNRNYTEKYVRAAQRVADVLSREDVDTLVSEMSDELRSAGLHGYELLELVKTVGKMFVMRLNMDTDAASIREYEEKCGLCSTVGRLFDCLRSFLTEQIRDVRSRLESEAIKPIRTAKQYVMQHYNQQITLADVCAVTGFSVSYFSKMFKNETGEGFSKYLAGVRMDKAKELLRDTDMPVAAICEAVGYSDIKHFTATFKKTTSLNPGQYRRLYG